MLQFVPNQQLKMKSVKAFYRLQQNVRDQKLIQAYEQQRRSGLSKEQQMAIVGQKDASLKKTAVKLMDKFVEKKRVQLLTHSFNLCHRQTMKPVLQGQNNTESSKVK